MAHNFTVGQVIRYQLKEDENWIYGICTETRGSTLRVYNEQGVIDPLSPKSTNIEPVRSLNEIPEIETGIYRKINRANFKTLLGAIESCNSERRSLFR